jgi:excisionase family DNA binding protein
MPTSERVAYGIRLSDAAFRLGVSQSTLRRWIKRDRLETWTIGRQRFVREGDVEVIRTVQRTEYRDD